MRSCGLHNSEVLEGPYRAQLLSLDRRVFGSDFDTAGFRGPPWRCTAAYRRQRLDGTGLDVCSAGGLVALLRGAAEFLGVRGAAEFDVCAAGYLFGVAVFGAGTAGERMAGAGFFARGTG